MKYQNNRNKWRKFLRWKEGEGTSAATEPKGEIISEIRTLLKQTIQPNYAEAEVLATTSAYFDNYDFVEDPLAQKDNALMKNTEVMLGEQLIHLIQNRV